jgi:hypothetical protein
MGAIISESMGGLPRIQQHAEERLARRRRAHVDRLLDSLERCALLLQLAHDVPQIVAADDVRRSLAPSGANGVHSYGGNNTAGVFPASTFTSANYYADVVFRPQLVG